jgi:ATP-dependent Clp protease adapter protein ClpS
MKNVAQAIEKEKDSLLTCLKYCTFQQVQEQNILGKLDQINNLEKNMIQTKPEEKKRNKVISFLEKVFQRSNALYLHNDDNVNGHIVIEALGNVLGFDRQTAMQKVMEAHYNEKSYLVSDDKKTLEKYKNIFSNIGITTTIE